MLKSLAVKYWPVILLFGAIVAILAMSRYAETSKSDKGENANTVNQTASVAAKGDQGKAEDKKPQNSPSWIKSFTWPDGVTTWALILTLIVIAWQSTETRAAAKATEDAVIEARASRTLAEHTAKRQLRAYLTVKDAILIFREDEMLEARVTVINSGSTPAYGFEGITSGCFKNHPFEQTPWPDRENIPVKFAFDIGAGQPYHITIKPVRFTPEQRHMLIELQTKLYAFVLNGWFTYRDIFKENHVLEFQLFIGKGTPIQRTTDQVALILHTDSTGNYCD